MKCTLWTEELLKKKRQMSIHSIYRHVVNLHAEGRILALHPDSIAVTPVSLAIPIEEDFHRISMAAREQGSVEIEGNYLQIGNACWNIGAIEAWNPVISDSLELSEIEALMEILKKYLIENGKKRGGLSDAAICCERNPKDHWMTAILREQVSRITGGSLENMEGLVEAAFCMLGQGMGLTPSGDDFLAGMMLAFSVWEYFPRKKWGLFTDMIQRNVTATNDISGQYLISACRREFGIRYHQLIEAVLRRKDIEEKLKDILEIGHSSGIDTLNGLVAGLGLIDKEYRRKKQ